MNFATRSDLTSENSHLYEATARHDRREGEEEEEQLSAHRHRHAGERLSGERRGGNNGAACEVVAFIAAEPHRQAHIRGSATKARRTDLGK